MSRCIVVDPVVDPVVDSPHIASAYMYVCWFHLASFGFAVIYDSALVLLLHICPVCAPCVCTGLAPRLPAPRGAALQDKGVRAVFISSRAQELNTLPPMEQRGIRVVKVGFVLGL